MEVLDTPMIVLNLKQEVENMQRVKPVCLTTIFSRRGNGDIV
jgi:hypothetical protein